MSDDYPCEIAEKLTLDELRMVLAGKVDSGGEGAQSWTSTFANDERIWRRTTTKPEPHLTRLGLNVYYAIIGNADLVSRIKESSRVTD